MKKIILLALATLMMVGCDTRTEEQRYNDDYLQVQNGYNVIIVDNCEYIVKTIDVAVGDWCATQSGYLAHKGNCRFCAERRKQEMELLVKHLKEK